MIEAEQLGQAYRGKAVLHDLTLDLAPGRWALVGPNGAGKTTLMRTLATLLSPATGTLRIDGQDATSRTGMREARNKIGYLPQRFIGMPGYTVREFFGHIAWLRGAATGQAHEAAVEILGVQSLINKKMKTLSGGSRQRVGICATLIGSPEIVFLDEPAVGLDPEQRINFRELLEAQANPLTLMSTHLMEDVGIAFPNLVVMTDGQARFQGSTREFAASHGQGGGTADLEAAYLHLVRGTR